MFSEFPCFKTSIRPSPSSLPPWLTPTTVTWYYQDFSHTPSTTVTSSFYQNHWKSTKTKSRTLLVVPSSKLSTKFLKLAKKAFILNGIHVEGPQIAICETISDNIFVLNSQFSQKDPYLHATLQEAIDAFNNVLGDFGCHKKIEKYKSQIHPTQPKQPKPKHPFYNI